jgi:hypothetical protein
MNNKKSAYLSKISKNEPHTAVPDCHKFLGLDSTKYQSSLLSKTSSKNKRM